MVLIVDQRISEAIVQVIVMLCGRRPKPGNLVQLSRKKHGGMGYNPIQRSTFQSTFVFCYSIILYRI